MGQLWHLPKREAIVYIHQSSQFQGLQVVNDCLVDEWQLGKIAA